MVGSALRARLIQEGYTRVISTSHKATDLEDWYSVRHSLFAETEPEYVFHCAARVGGIVDNKEHPADFFVSNSRMQLNVIQAAHETGVKKLLFLGSACAYPKFATVPITEDALLTGALEPTNELYALAKIGGIKLCDAYRTQYGDHFISAMPTNLYGRNDHYDLQNSHVIPGMIHRFHKAMVDKKSEVVLWGTGMPKRDFVFADDAASACMVLMDKFDWLGPVNICTGTAISLRDLAETVAVVVGFKGKILWDESRPDGTPDRTMDGSWLRTMGWEPSVSLTLGLTLAYQDFLWRHTGG